MKTVLMAILIGFVGYIIGVILGMIGINMFSTNKHDKSVEAAMTSFFIIGPAIAFFSSGVFLLRRKMR